MNDFKKEIKYLVLKYKDIEAAGFSDEEKVDMYRLINRIELARAQRGKPPLECVVVESEWHCYDKVWEMVELEYNQNTSAMVGKELK